MNAERDRSWQRMFLSAALYNGIVAGGLVLGGPPVFDALGIAPKPVHPMWFHLFAMAVALFGYMYFRVSRDLSQTVLVEMGAIGKVLTFTTVVVYWFLGEASWHVVALGAIDAVYAVLFIRFLRHARSFTRGTR